MGNVFKKFSSKKFHKNFDENDEFEEIFVDELPENSPSPSTFNIAVKEECHKKTVEQKLDFETELITSSLGKAVVEPIQNSESTSISVPETILKSKDSLSVAEKLSNADSKCKEIISNWTQDQIQMREKLVLTEDSDFLSNLKYVAGVDISFPSNKEDLVHACACIVVLSYPELKIIHKILKIVHLTSIYVPEYLAFREVEPLVELFQELKLSSPEILPQLILVDGNGILHPRKFGLACQLGVVLDIPTIGVSKKLFHVDGLEKNNDFKTKIKQLDGKGSSFDLQGNSGFLFGKALRSTDKSINPIFVSVGHKMSLQTSVDIVSKCSVMRVPEPIRWADILSREFIRDNYIDHENWCVSYKEMNDYFCTLAKLIV